MNTKEDTYHYNDYFKLESGNVLPGFQLKYSALGNLNSDKSNVVWVCHALTGSSDFTSWWGELFTEQGPFDPSKYFIISANALGGCYGSTGPLSENPETDDAYYHDFPTITNLDIVKAFDLLRTHLGFERIHTLIGGSLGGQQVLTWAVTQPGVFETIIPIACNAAQSAWGIGINEAQRMAIEADPTWLTRDASAGRNGLKAARAISMITFRSYEAFLEQSEYENQKLDDFRASSYQRHQGDKLANRFDAFSYFALTKAMDSHNIGRHFISAENALQKVQADTLVIGIDSDLLFPISEQEFINKHIPISRLERIHSRYGHDAFLIETDQLKSIIHQFLKKKSKLIFQ